MILDKNYSSFEKNQTNALSINDHALYDFWYIDTPYSWLFDSKQTFGSGALSQDPNILCPEASHTMSHQV